MIERLDALVRLANASVKFDFNLHFHTDGPLWTWVAASAALVALVACWFWPHSPKRRPATPAQPREKQA